MSVMESAYWAKGSTGSGVGLGAIVESAQATQASHVEAEAVAEDVMVDEALPDVTDETVAVEELLTTEPLDGAMEEPATELAEFVGDGCVADGWLTDGCWAVASGLSGPAFSISWAVAAAAAAAASSGATAAAMSARASADARVAAASVNEVRTVASSALRAVKAVASAMAFADVTASWAAETACFKAFCVSVVGF